MGQAGDFLAGKKILVTRPDGQQTELCQAIEAAGGIPLHVPLLDIRPVVEPDRCQALRARILDLDRYSTLIFVSTNAARLGAEWIDQYWAQFPTGVRVLAIGPSTAEQVASLLEVEVLQSAKGMDSESILELPVLRDVGGQRIGIFRGIGGRELLAETLRRRGAEVDYLEVYSRGPRHYDAPVISQLLTDPGVDLVSVTSGESLNALLDLAGPKAGELLQLSLLVPSERVAEQARELGFCRVLRAAGADTPGTMVALRAWSEATQTLP